MSELSTRDSKLVQYLNEAYGKEKQLETALQAHIGMTTRMPYKKRLQQHLVETRRHARELERRIKRLGGSAEAGPIEGPDAIAKGASAAATVASKAVAVAKGPLHALRGTGEQEKMLKNAKTEYADEHEEIATYSAIETLADAVGDRDTLKLARAIRREEERMARFLERLIPALTKAVTQEEIPAAERRANGARSRSSGARNGTRTSRAKSGASRTSASRSSGKARKPAGARGAS
jgi:ferritin-like metal-binding protein YciE